MSVFDADRLTAEAGRESAMTEAVSTLRSVPEGDSDIDVFAARWRRALKAGGKSDKTIHDYLRVLGLKWHEASQSAQPITWADSFPAYLMREGRPLFVADVTREDIEGYRARFLEGVKADGTPYSVHAARVYTAALKSFFRWLTEDIEALEANPAEKVRLPVPKQKVIPAPDLAVVDATLATTRKTRKHAGHKQTGFCNGCFTNARDRAIIGALMSSGSREKGMADVKLADLNLDAGYFKITLKGGDEHLARLDAETVRDLDDYLALRARHPKASSPFLWLGPRGKMTGSGLYQMIKARAAQAGVPNLTVHGFRRFSATAAAREGLSTEELMDIYGWQDRSMAARYTASERQDRAAAAHSKVKFRSREG